MSSPALADARPAGFAFVELMKPRITLLVMLTALVGYVMASPGGVALGGLAATLAGTGLVAAGASALNMLLERRTDALMHRTRNRPLPSGRLRAADGLAWGVLLTVSGLATLFALSTPAAAAVAFVTWASYLFLYTPLKTRTSLSTVVGAFPGALPPVIGWAGARGTVEPGAFALFAILFLWQIPHFLAIAWIYREDYARGGLPMLPVVDPAGGIAGRQAVANSLGLLLVSLAPAFGGMAGGAYLAGALVLGLVFIGVAVWCAVARSLRAARALFATSILYLAALCALLVIDRVG